MNWTYQEKWNYLTMLSEKQQLSDDDQSILSLLSKDEESAIRSKCASELIFFSSDDYKKILLDLTYDPDTLVRTEACDSLCIYSDREVFNRLLDLSTKDKYLVRSYAVLSMADVAINGAFDISETFTIMEHNFLKEKSIHVKLSYYYAFCVFGRGEYYDLILQNLFHKLYQIKCVAIHLIMELVNQENYDKTLHYLMECKKHERSIAVSNSLSKAICKIVHRGWTCFS